jgi:lipoyl-dependent peroxiredoxin subunit D
MSIDIGQKLEVLFQGRESLIARDLRLNLKKILEESSIAGTDGYLALLAAARAVDSDGLAIIAREALIAADFTSEQIGEAEESAAIMAMLNTYYRFKHMVGKDEDYRSTGLRMTALAKPLLGKERFEMLALTVSILNGCEACIKAHEKVLREGGVPAEKVHDLARLAAVVKGIGALL